MNWLAHLVLSEPAPPFRIGNLLPDLAPWSALLTLPPEFRRGVEAHRRIDAFTDSHPIFRRSMLRVEPELRRYAGVLVDIYYDHFLSCEWPAYSAIPLREFLDEFYASFPPYGPDIPPEAYTRLEQMQAADWLGSYGDLGGVYLTLSRMARRFRKPVPLADGAATLERHYAGFREDFLEFFPMLQAHVGVAKM